MSPKIAEPPKGVDTMQNQPFTAASTAATAALGADAVENEFDVATTEEDPAGGITLSGRSRLIARARILAGMAMTAGVVAVMNGIDTVSSRTHGL